MGAARAATPGAAKRELADMHRTLCADLCRDPIPCSFGGGVQIARLPAVLTSQNRRRPNSHKARLTRGPRATPAKAGPPLAGQPVPSPAGVAGCALGPRPQEQRSLPADRNGGSQETFACAPKPSGAFARPAGVGEPVSAREMRCLPHGRDQPALRTVSASLGSDGQTDRRPAGRHCERIPAVRRMDRRTASRERDSTGQTDGQPGDTVSASLGSDGQTDGQTDGQPGGTVSGSLPSDGRTDGRPAGSVRAPSPQMRRAGETRRVGSLVSRGKAVPLGGRLLAF